MISHFRFQFLIALIFILHLSCLDITGPEQHTGFTSKAQVFVDRIMEENPGATYNVDVIVSYGNSGLGQPTEYVLALNVADKVVLTNTIDSLREHGIYRKDKSGYGTGGGIVDLPFKGIKVACDTLDSIEIVTNTVITFEIFDLRWNNLTHLPPEIGKIRTRSLDISYNRLSHLPLEIMQLLEPPQYYTFTRINMNMLQNLEYDSLPDTLKNWFENEYANQNFD